jgi:D-3-phosphoglycerate dehydrogenase
VKILVTPRSLSKGDHPQLQRLRDAGFELVFPPAGQTPSEADLLRLLPGCRGMLAGVEPIGARVLRSAEGLRVIARNGVGINNVDLEAAKERNIAVLPAPGANARGVAELAIGLILAVARAIPASDRALKSGQWQRQTGIELEGRTLGVVGCGNIGRRVAKIALGLDMNVLAYDRYPNSSLAPSGSFKFTSLDDLLTRSDVVSLHCPPLADGRPILDAANLNRLRKGAIVINTARADLVDADAMAAALESGRVAGYGVDVFDPEPPGDWPLLRHDRVVATPHVGGLTQESIERATTAAVDNLIQFLAEKP